MTHDDQKQLVALGYDCIADTYLERFGGSSVRTAKLAELIEQLPADASVLDLGCVAGIPVARELVRLGFDVTGVDAAEGQIERARRNVPQARFFQADMAAVQFAPETFDAVSAFYSVTHLPRAADCQVESMGFPGRSVCDSFRRGGDLLCRDLIRRIFVSG